MEEKKPHTIVHRTLDRQIQIELHKPTKSYVAMLSSSVPLLIPFVLLMLNIYQQIHPQRNPTGQPRMCNLVIQATLDTVRRQIKQTTQELKLYATWTPTGLKPRYSRRVSKQFLFLIRDPKCYIKIENTDNNVLLLTCIFIIQYICNICICSPLLYFGIMTDVCQQNVEGTTRCTNRLFSKYTICCMCETNI